MPNVDWSSTFYLFVNATSHLVDISNNTLGIFVVVLVVMHVMVSPVLKHSDDVELPVSSSLILSH